MSDQNKNKTDEAVIDIEKQIDVIQIQVLNNLDSLLAPNGQAVPGVDMKMIDLLVKGPLMRSLTKIKHARLLIWKANQQR